MSHNLYDVLSHQNRNNDGDVFLTTVDGAAWTYGDLDALTRKVMTVLAEQGVKPGDRVAAYLPKSKEALALYFGVVRFGAVFLPLNTAYTGSELSYFFEDAEPSLIVCAPEHQAAVEQIAGSASVLTLGTTGDGSLWDLVNSASPASADGAPVDRDDLAAILYTSGTTGKPKGAMLTHHNLSSNALTLRDYWRFTKDDKLLHVLPVFHTHGLFVATNTVFAAGGSMLFAPKFTVDLALEHLPNVTSMMAVPTLYTRLLDSPKFTKAASEHMRLFTSGSAPLLAQTHDEFSARTGHRILERYGMTEINMATSNPYDGDRLAGTVGFPLPGVDLRIVDEAGNAVADGETGSIEVRGPNVFKGYWRKPDKTAEDFRDDGFFISGDLGRLNEQGYVQIVGRSKDLIISGGFNVYPKEIESVIDDVDGVKESAVIGLPHADFGEGVTAVVVRDGSALTEVDISESVSDKLAKFKQPKAVILVDELPRNAMGKVQKNLLRDEYADLYDKA